MYAFMKLCAACAYRFPGRPEAVIRSLDTEVIDVCEPPDIGSQNQTSAGAVKKFKDFKAEH